MSAGRVFLDPAVVGGSNRLRAKRFGGPPTSTALSGRAATRRGGGGKDPPYATAGRVRPAAGYFFTSFPSVSCGSALSLDGDSTPVFT